MAQRSGPDTSIATPCRTRRKLSFRGASQETLKPTASTESLDSTDRNAINERLRTVDRATPTPSPRSASSKADKKGVKDEKDDKVDEPERKDELEESGKKGNKAQEPGKSKVAGKTPAQRMKQFLEDRKTQKLDTKSSNQDANGKSTKRKAKEEASKKSKQGEGKKEVEVPKKQPKKPKTSEKDKTDEEVQPAKDEEDIATEEEKKKAHAMYMKYWRSLKSF